MQAVRNELSALWAIVERQQHALRTLGFAIAGHQAVLEASNEPTPEAIPGKAWLN